MVLPGGSLGVIAPTERASPRYIPPASERSELPPIYPGLDDDEIDESAEPTSAVAVPVERRTRPSPGLGPSPGTALGLLLLRLAVGALVLARGAHQLWGVLGDSHVIEALPTAVSVAELVVGVLLVLGLLTEWASGAVLALVVAALPEVLEQPRVGVPVIGEPGLGVSVHALGPALLLGLGVLAVALALAGAGRISLDHGRVWTRAPLRTAAVALVLGAAVGAVLQLQLA